MIHAPFQRPLRIAGALLIAMAAVNVAHDLAFPPAGRSAVPGLLVELVGAALGAWLAAGRLAAVRPAAWYAALGIGFGVAALLVLMPVLKPPAAWLQSLRHEPLVDGPPLLKGLLHLAVLLAVYRLLRAAPVRAARRAAGLGLPVPWTGFALGALSVLALAGALLALPR